MVCVPFNLKGKSFRKDFSPLLMLNNIQYVGSKTWSGILPGQYVNVEKDKWIGLMCLNDIANEFHLIYYSPFYCEQCDALYSRDRAAATLPNSVLLGADRITSVFRGQIYVKSNSAWLPVPESMWCPNNGINEFLTIKPSFNGNRHQPV